MRDIWNAIDLDLQRLTKIYHQDTTNILRIFGPKAEIESSWDLVSFARRLDILAVITNISADVWKDAYENDMMSRLTLTAYAGLVKHHKENRYGV